MTDTQTGIGRALRKARQHRGRSLHRASRELRMRTEYVRALETEEWDVFDDEVYVRGFLRSYSRYLGLDPEKVLSAYDRTGPQPEPVPEPEPEEPARTEGPGEHRWSAWALAGALAVIALFAVGAIGLFSPDASTPDPADNVPPPDVAVLTRAVQVDLEAKQDVTAVILVDGTEQFSGRLERGEARSFEGDQRIEVRFGVGSRVRVVVNGESIGTPGDPRLPYEGAWTPSSFRRD